MKNSVIIMSCLYFSLMNVQRATQLIQKCYFIHDSMTNSIDGVRSEHLSGFVQVNSIDGVKWSDSCEVNTNMRSKSLLFHVVTYK